VINPWKKLSKINPQRESGHRQICNGVYQALVHLDLSASEYKICLFVIDKTWGFNKSFDTISTSQFQEATGLSELKSPVPVAEQSTIGYGSVGQPG
jgi:phage replication O-like protein O